MTIKAQQFLLPDLHALCPLESSMSPHYHRAAKESSDWISGYNVFNDRRAIVIKEANSELLVAHAYPYAPYERFRTVCDFINLLFVFDETSDEQTGEDAAATGDIFHEAMRNPDYSSTSKLSQMTKDFRARYFKVAGPTSSARFLRHLKDYINSVATEAEYRERDEILDVDAFMELRRNNSAVILCFDLLEYVLGIELPDEVYEDPTFEELYWSAVDMVCWANDLYSWNMEQAKGISGNNIVTVLMKHKNMKLQSACDYVGLHCDKLVRRYLSARDRLPSWGSSKLDRDVARFAEACGHWMKGNLDWSFESSRYFGSANSEVKRTRLVTLSRPSDSDDSDSDTS
ncbi:terpenoid synthase [Marasmius fiardii PR-910]|nr:terpenoid synthase [Marasmius fiardii PR-910]